MKISYEQGMSINKKILRMDENQTAGKEVYYTGSFGEKPIPYIGWYWRSVMFHYDTAPCFGVIPKCADLGPLETPPDRNLVGFMESNKWGYPEIYPTPEQWEHIKILLVEAVRQPTRLNLRNLDIAIQELAHGMDWEGYYENEEDEEYGAVSYRLIEASKS